MPFITKNRPQAKPVIPEVGNRPRTRAANASSLNAMFATGHQAQPLNVSPDIGSSDIPNHYPSKDREAEYQTILTNNKHPFWDGQNGNTSLHPSIYDLRNEYEQILLETPEERRDLTSTLALGMLSFARYAEGYSNYQAPPSNLPFNEPQSTFKEPSISSLTDSPKTAPLPELPGAREGRAEEDLQRMLSHQQLPRHRKDWIKYGNTAHEINTGLEQESLKLKSQVPYMSPLEPSDLAAPKSPAVTPLTLSPYVTPMRSFEPSDYQDSGPSQGSRDRTARARTQAPSYLSGAAPAFIPRSTTNTPSSRSSEVSFSDNSNTPSRSSRARRRRRSRGTQTAVFPGPGRGMYYDRTYPRGYENINFQRARGLYHLGYESNGSPSPTRRRPVWRWYLPQ